LKITTYGIRTYTHSIFLHVNQHNTVLYSDCRRTAEGLGYIGTRSYTVSGRQCQRWDEQIPHPHNYTTLHDKRFPEGDIREARNFCRNPDKKTSGPWCYTTDPEKEWETCQVPICSGKICVMAKYCAVS